MRMLRHVAIISLSSLCHCLKQSHYKRLVLVCKRQMANSSNHKCLQIIQNFTVHFYEHSTLHILWQPVSPASRQTATNTRSAYASEAGMDSTSTARGATDG